MRGCSHALLEKKGFKLALVAAHCDLLERLVHIGVVGGLQGGADSCMGAKQRTVPSASLFPQS